jgi:hypothetical protein
LVKLLLLAMLGLNAQPIDHTKALQRAFDSACQKPDARVHLPAGTYNISAPLVARCAMTIEGEGPERSIIFQTVHGKLNHAIATAYPLTVQDLGINTEAIAEDLQMVAVFRSDTSPVPSTGQAFTFQRFHSSGFNFAIDIAASAGNLGDVVVRDSKLSVSTSAGAVSNPVNVRNAESLTVENNTLLGDGNNDHAIYLIGVRKILIRKNIIDHHGNSAIKLLTQGFHSPSCPALSDDYSSWIVMNNTITNSKLALAAYTYCDIKLPGLVIAYNQISNIDDHYEGDNAAMYIEAACQSVMENVTLAGNTFSDIGLSGVFLLSSTEGPPCAGPRARGTIGSFSSTGDTFVNFSTAYPGAYFAISASGPNLKHATIRGLRSDGRTNGRGPLNLDAFAEGSIAGDIEVNKSCAWLSTSAAGECASPCFRRPN